MSNFCFFFSIIYPEHNHTLPDEGGTVLHVKHLVHGGFLPWALGTPPRRVPLSPEHGGHSPAPWLAPLLPGCQWIEHFVRTGGVSSQIHHRRASHRTEFGSSYGNWKLPLTLRSTRDSRLGRQFAQRKSKWSPLTYCFSSKIILGKPLYPPSALWKTKPNLKSAQSGCLNRQKSDQNYRWSKKKKSLPMINVVLNFKKPHSSWKFTLIKG